MSNILRPANERGHADHGWLDSHHTFSFADYYDAAHMGFGPLRVINDDRVAAGGGFGTHGHRDMEIISYVIEGGLQHKDSLGSGSVITPGDVQVMSAGSGVRHSEFNASKTAPVRFLQIWLMPEEQGATPRYAQKNYAAVERRNVLRLVVSGDGRDGSLPIRQNAEIYATVLDAGAGVAHALAPGRRSWVQIATGAAEVNGVAMAEGDGLAIEDEKAVSLVSQAPDTQILLFDLPD